MMQDTGPGKETSPEAARPPARSPAPASLFGPAELLSRLWRQNLPLLRERIACLEAAAEEAMQGQLTPARRTEASDLAHKLAGSLGMFGYPQGTTIARAMEQLLEADNLVDPAVFAALTAQLRAALPL